MKMPFSALLVPGPIHRGEHEVQKNLTLLALKGVHIQSHKGTEDPTHPSLQRTRDPQPQHWTSVLRSHVPGRCLQTGTSGHGASAGPVGPSVIQTPTRLHTVGYPASCLGSPFPHL